MVGLLDLRASYFNGQVNMSWQFPRNAPEAVHIYGVKRVGNEAELDARDRITKDLRDCTNGLSFEYSGISNADVRNVTFCVFLAARNLTSPNIRALQALGGCFVSVIIGRAYVQYDIICKFIGADLYSHQINLSSSSSFEPGILGYSYNFNGKPMVVELPGRVESGMRRYPPIYLSRYTEPPYVCLLDGANADVAIERRKISGYRVS